MSHRHARGRLSKDQQAPKMVRHQFSSLAQIIIGPPEKLLYQDGARLQSVPTFLAPTHFLRLLNFGGCLSACSLGIINFPGACYWTVLCPNESNRGGIVFGYNSGIFLLTYKIYDLRNQCGQGLPTEDRTLLEEMKNQ